MLGYQQAKSLESSPQGYAPEPEREVGGDNAFALEQLGLGASGADGGAAPLGLAGRDSELPAWAGEMSAGDALAALDFGEADAGGSVPASVIEWVDAHLPPGIGVQGSAALGLKLGIGAEGEAGITVINEGEGWLTVEATGSLTGEFAVGVGASVLEEGAEAEVGANQGVTGTRVFRVPWTRLCDLPTLVELGATALLGSVGQCVPADLLEPLIGGRDLTSYLMKESVALTEGVGASASGGLLGEELGVEAGLTGEIGVSCEYEDLADERGFREGELRVSGTAEGLVKAAIDLSKSLGIDTDCVVPQISGGGALVVPFTEEEGVKTFSAPYLELSADGAIGPVGVGGSTSLGPDHVGIEAHVEVDPGSLLWQKVLDDSVGIALEAATVGLAEVETSGSMTLGVEMSLDDPAFANPAAVAADAFAWLTTGEVGEALSQHVSVLERLAASADLTLAVDLTVASVTAELEEEVGVGVMESARGAGELGVVYQRDDVLGDLSAPPSVQEVLAAVRAGSPAGPAAA